MVLRDAPPQYVTVSPPEIEQWRRRVEEGSPERVGSALMLVVRFFDDRVVANTWSLRQAVDEVLRLPWTVSDEDALLAARGALRAPAEFDSYVPLRVAEALLGRRFGPVVTDPAAIGAIQRMIDVLARRGDGSPDNRDLLVRLCKLLPGELGMAVIVDADGWAKAVRPRLTDGSLDADVVAALLRQLLDATGSKPTKSWAAQTARVLESGPARTVLRVLVESVAEAPGAAVEGNPHAYGGNLLLSDYNGDVVRAAIWATASLTEPWVVPAVAAIARRAFTRGEGVIMSQKVPNAVIHVLGRLGAVQELSALDAIVSDNGFRKRIAAALTDAGSARGLTPSQVVERMVEDGGLDEHGTVEYTRGAVTARATLNEDLSVTVAWRDQADWVSKPPAGAHTELVNAVKRLVADLRRLVARERNRVEGLFAEDRGWDMAEWRRYYADHPITGRIAARLLWRFGDETKLGGDPDLPETGSVRLWHPARAPLDEVVAWRDKLFELGTRQPFKQAYREVYLLTDAERETCTYSNRFAAHVLRYNQTFALFKERGWVANYLGSYSGGYEGKARREFRDAGITAVFAHFAVDTATDPGGTPDLCTTDRVWFHRTADRAKTAIPVGEVPPLVFGEAMRDVDLFVGVASIALDPNWVDGAGAGGGANGHVDYWHRVSFGELTARAQVRRDALARILPKLRVADRVELGDRYVTVRGELAEYKIHLGSANILVQPGDRYLCVVPRGGRSKVMLPFDGDDVLSVILSKIVLLAADRKITDRTILNQIGSGG